MTETSDLQRKLSAIDDLERAQRATLPRAFGPYVLVDSLAKGGMGEVFLARSGGAGLVKYCVVKTLRPHLTDDREYVARFLDEARVVVQLSHKNICQVFDVGLVGERYYLAMELIAGDDLRTLSDRTGMMSPALAVFIVAEVLEALDYAHRITDVQGAPLHLVHRDVSPQNIMCSFEGEVKLIDFGLAQSAVKVEKTSPTMVMGKLAYMSPEQLRGEHATRGVDLFATAVVLTELLIGHRFYEQRNSHDTWLLAAKGGHRPQAFASIPDGLREVIDRALDVDPDKRFDDALAFRTALLSWLRDQRQWADGPVLRERMQRLFKPQIDAHRARLQSIDGMEMPSTSVEQEEPSRTIARAAATTTTTTVEVPPARLPSAEDSTAFIRDAPIQKKRDRRPVIAAAVAAAAVIVVVLAMPFRAMHDASTPTTPIVADDLTDLIENNSAFDDEPPLELGDDDEPLRTPRRPRRPKPQSPPPAPVATPAPTPVPAPVKTTSWDDLATGERLALLSARCGKLTCTKALRDKGKSWGTLKAAEMRDFKAALEACRARCGLR